MTLSISCESWRGDLRSQPSTNSQNRLSTTRTRRNAKQTRSETTSGGDTDDTALGVLLAAPATIVQHESLRGCLRAHLRGYVPYNLVRLAHATHLQTDQQLFEGIEECGPMLLLLQPSLHNSTAPSVVLARFWPSRPNRQQHCGAGLQSETAKCTSRMAHKGNSGRKRHLQRSCALRRHLLPVLHQLSVCGGALTECCGCRSAEGRQNRPLKLASETSGCSASAVSQPADIHLRPHSARTTPTKGNSSRCCAVKWPAAALIASAPTGLC